MKDYIKLLGWIILLIPFQLSAQKRYLDFYINQAKINSPFIHQNQNEKELAKLDLEQIRRVYSKPEVTLEGNVLFAPIISRDNGTRRFQLTTKDASDYTGFDLAATDGGQYEAIVSVRQGVFNASKIQAYSEKAEVQDKIYQNNIEMTLHELENAVRHQYILCLKSKKQQENAQQLVGEIKDEIETMKRLVVSAVYKKTDLMLLEITLQDYLQQYQASRSEFEASLYDLNLLCGITSEPDVNLQDISLTLAPELNGASAFLNSYFLDSLSVAAELKISELKYKPDVNLFANGGMNAVYLPSLNRFGLSTGISLSWTIFDGHQRDIDREKAVIKTETLSFEKQKTSDQTRIQKNYALTQIESLDKRIALADQQLVKYAELLEAYKRQLEQAEISVMDFKYLVKEIAAKKQELVQLQMEKQIVVNAYNYWNY